MPYSAQEFVKALKASADPPHPGGPTKLDIARATWDDHSVYVPNKDETIVEWILTRLLKEKDTQRSVDRPKKLSFLSLTRKVCSLKDIQIWKLLHDILQTSALAAKAARPLRTWLLPLLNRTPCAPVLIAFLNSAEGHTPDLLSVGSRALALIWPLAVPRISADTLLDCFGAVARLFTPQFWQRCDNSTRTTVLRIVNLVVSSYRSSLASSGTKKKVR